MGAALTNGIPDKVLNEPARIAETESPAIPNSSAVVITDVASAYSSGHLTFRRDFIEPLADSDWFEISTPAGRFRMTKADFHKHFPEVAASSSYRDLGQYHYPMIPYKTFRFLVREDKTSGDGSVSNEQPGSEV